MRPLFHCGNCFFWYNIGMARLRTAYKEFLIAIVPVILFALLARLSTGTFSWQEMFAGKSPLSGLVIERSADVVTNPGANQNLWVEFENRSDITWTQDGENAIYLLTDRALGDPFYLPGSTWITDSKVGLFEDEVAPGETGHFRFTINTDLDVGDYTARFRLVDANLKELQGVKPITWQIDIAEPEWGFELVSQSDNPTVTREQTVTLTATFRNTGNTTWHNWGEHPIRLAVSGESETDFYIDPRWPDEFHPAFIDETSIAPGEEGTFTFDIKAPDSLGVVRAEFKPEVYGIDNLDLPSVSYDITVAEEGEAAETELPGQRGELPHDSQLHMTAVPVGHGDCYVVITPNDEVVLFDTGHPSRANVVITALHQLGVDEIDHLILSHSHWDHIGGAPYIMDYFPVKQIYVNGEGYPYETYARLAEYFSNNGSNVEVVSRGDLVPLGPEVTMSIYNPAEPLSGINENDEAVNNNSLVARISWEGRALLLTSDIYTASIEELLQTDLNLQAEVLTLPHHGNDGFGDPEKQFLEKVNPLLAIKSSDWGELETQTSPEMGMFLLRQGIQFVATAREGLVNITVPTEGLEMESDSLVWRE